MRAAGKPLADPLGGIQNQMADSRGEITGIHRIDAGQLSCRQQTVLVGAGKRASQIQMNHFIALVHKGPEIIQILLHVNGRRPGKNFPS